MKIFDDTFLEMPLHRAASFIENKIKVTINFNYSCFSQILSERAEQNDKMSSHIRAHMDLVLSSLEELYAAEKSQI